MEILWSVWVSGSSEGEINKGFKTFTILEGSTFTSFKGHLWFCVINTWLLATLCSGVWAQFSGRSLTEAQVQIENYSVVPVLVVPTNSKARLKKKKKKGADNLRSSAWARPRITFRKCWFLLTLWDPTGLQTTDCRRSHRSQIKSNKRLCQLQAVHPLWYNLVQFEDAIFLYSLWTWPKLLAL